MTGGALKRMERSWSVVHGHLIPFESSSFCLSSFNLLAQHLVRREMFPYAGKETLKWKFRRDNLLNEFLSHNADVGAFQEMDNFSKFFHPQLYRRGYSACYYDKEGEMKHGIAVVFKRDRFSLAAHIPVDYDASMTDATMRKNNAGQICVLDAVGPEATNSGPKGIIVANTHLYWHPKHDLIRLAQLSILLQKVQETVRAHPQHAVVVVGDFNTPPSTIVYEILTRPVGTFQSDEVVRLLRSDQDSEPGEPLQPVVAAWLQRLYEADLLLPLQSASCIINAREPPLTNFVETFCDTLDYVFLTGSSSLVPSLKVLGFLDFPTKEEILATQKTPLPTNAHASDHLPVVTMLSIH